MEVAEEWVVLEDFPRYAVSNHGRVMNTETENIKMPTLNQQGIPSVNLIQDRVQNRLSVAVLVAHVFLPPPDNTTFDTPINLDGDRENNRVDNLAWRPRWFARRYHSQLKAPVEFGFKGGIEVLETGETFDDIRECAIKYGLLEKEIILGAHNSVPVFPTWYTFRII